MTGHDQPDPSLIVLGKRAPKPHNLDAEVSGASQGQGKANAKKNTHTCSTSAENSANTPVSKKTKVQEKQSRISDFTSAAEKTTSELEQPPTTTSQPPPTNSTEPTAAPTPTVTQGTAVRKNQHRLEYEGRPKVNCAADHPFLRNKDSLVWTFLSLTNPIHNAAETKLIGGTLQCAFCIAEGKLPPQAWQFDREKWDGSTGNFFKHFKKSHGQAWNSVAVKDLEKLNPGASMAQEAQGPLHSWSKVSSADILSGSKLRTIPRCLIMRSSCETSLNGWWGQTSHSLWSTVPCSENGLPTCDQFSQQSWSTPHSYVNR